MTIEYFNIFYFLYVSIFIGLTILIDFILKKTKEEKRSYIIFSILIFGFILHFCKLFFEPYRSGLPYTFRKVTPENICAVSTLLFPFFYLSKNKYLKDYMFYIGILSGILAILFPTEGLGKSPFIFDTIRFYICHMILAIAPLMMVKYKTHILNYHRILVTPLIFFAVLSLILVNEIVLIEGGFVNMRTIDFMNPNYRNSSFIFGPLPAFEEPSKLLTALTPKCFKTVMVGEYAGQVKYAPILWLIVPAYIYMPIVFLLMSIPTDKFRMKYDLLVIKSKLKGIQFKLNHKRG